MILSVRALRQLEDVTCRMSKLAGAAVSGLRFHTSFSYVTSRPSHQENPQSLPSLPPLVDQITDQAPHLVLPAVKLESTGNIVYRFFNPINEQVVGILQKKSCELPNTARHFWSSHGLLAFFDFNGGGLYLWAPPFSTSSDFSNRVIKLPSVESFPSVVGVTRNMDGSIEKIRRRLRGPDSFCFWDMTPEDYHCLIGQLALSSFPSSTSSNVTVMGKQGRNGGLAFCKLGDATWTGLEAPDTCYDSLTYCSKDRLFYAFSSMRMIEGWDVHDPSSTKRISVDRYVDCPMPNYGGLEAALRMESGKKYYLVESSGDLLLVVRHYFRKGCFISHSKQDTYQTVRFDVFKFDLASPTNWTHVENLQDRALFVGQTNPFSLSTGDFPGLIGNSIYFGDDHLDFSYERTSNHDVGVFNLEENSLKFYHPFGSIDGTDDPPVWIAPNMWG